MPVPVDHRIEPVDPPGKRDEHRDPDGEPEPGLSKKRAGEHREKREADAVDHKAAQLGNPQQGLYERRGLTPEGGIPIQQAERRRRGQEQPRAKSSGGITGPPEADEQPEKKKSENPGQVRGESRSEAVCPAGRFERHCQRQAGPISQNVPGFRLSRLHIG